MLTTEKESISRTRNEIHVAPQVIPFLRKRRLNDRTSIRVPASEPVVHIRQASSNEELDEVYRITHDAYLERDYCTPQPDGRLIHYPTLENIPETTVLVALLKGRIMGTVSLTLDGPQGFHVDHDFKSKCDEVRSERRRLCACWRIATRSAQRGERQVVMALIGAAVSSAFETLHCETMLCSFNPRHERIYKRLLNMRTIAHGESTEGLHQAPAVLMRCDIETLPQKWLKDSSTAVRSTR